MHYTPLRGDGLRGILGYMDRDVESSVDKLQRRLYQRGAAPKERDRRPLHEEAHRVAPGWDSQEEAQNQREFEQGSLEEYAQQVEKQVNPSAQVPAYLRDKHTNKDALARKEKQRTTTRVVRSIFLTALAFFILSAGVAWYFFFYEHNQISCDNVKIDVTGPLSVPSGKELTLNVGILNKNPTPVQLAELVVNYPEGTRSVQNSAISLTTARERVGTIASGERVRTSVRALLYGKEQSESTIDLIVEYRIDESNAVFVCKAPYKVIIATSPVGLVVDGLEEVSSGQELVLTATVSSNADETVRDQRLVAEYPFGFEFVRAEPKPTNDLNAWDVGDISPGSKRTVTIYGIVNAATVEARSIKFRLGEKDKEKADGLLTTLQLVEHPFLIARAFINLDLVVNDIKDPDVPAKMGEEQRAVLHWKNTLPYAIYDVEIEASLDSPLINPSTVRQGQGYYRSVDRTIVWTGQTSPKLKSLGPGESGQFEFSFNTVPLAQDTSTLGPNIIVAFTVRARRTSDDAGVSGKLVSQSKRTIKFESQLAFDYEILRALGPFINTGVHPPIPDHESTYTIHWSLKNNTNEVNTVKATAELPINVRWLDAISPEDGSLTYNPTTHMVVWTPGTIPAGTGSRSPTREVYYQVALTPSITDNLETTSVILEPRLTGVDAYTQSVIEIKPRDLYVSKVRGE